MEFVTFVAVSYIINKTISIRLHDVKSVLSDLKSEVNIFIKMGFEIIIANESNVIIYPPKLVFSQDILAHPDGVYSDSQPILAILDLFGDSPSKIEDMVWKGRFSYLKELKKIGVECTITNNYALLTPFTAKSIECPTQLIGSDLRSSAALLLFSLRYKELDVIDLGHLKRGYNCITDKLNSLVVI
jgi:UDP-N-acetylglucosamine enolpyruvyl transferase